MSTLRERLEALSPAALELGQHRAADAFGPVYSEAPVYPEADLEAESRGGAS